MADFAHQTHTVSTQLTFGACSALEAPTDEMPLTLLDQAEAEARGALCLDGSAPGLYFAPGVGRDASRWVIALKGGGQCWDDAQCADMAGTIFGSNALFPRRPTRSSRAMPITLHAHAACLPTPTPTPTPRHDLRLEQALPAPLKVKVAVLVGPRPATTGSSGCI